MSQGFGLSLAHIASLMFVFAAMGGASQADKSTSGSIFAKDNLVAWCIVPFDASRRTPEQRAEMIARLGLKKVAYDWREEHVPTFEEEILAYKKHGIEYFAFWDVHEAAFALFEKHGISPQIWKSVPDVPGANQTERVESAARQMLPLVERARQLGCKVGLYNHGGWPGEPDTMIAVCQWLRRHADAQHVGIVYNFHHGHDHIPVMAIHLAAMKPYLLCVNINGMNDSANPKILPVGSGQHDVELLRTLQQSGYRGPVGILDHRPELDAEESLRQNLDGLKKVLATLGDEQALQSFAAGGWRSSAASPQQQSVE